MATFVANFMVTSSTTHYQKCPTKVYLSLLKRWHEKTVKTVFLIKTCSFEARNNLTKCQQLISVNFFLTPLTKKIDKWTPTKKLWLSSPEKKICWPHNFKHFCSQVEKFKKIKDRSRCRREKKAPNGADACSLKFNTRLSKANCRDCL